ncbi:hypothetical protein F4813DRAFT_210968 [Daldinia decipiens]|uniref:uncharacterized protein n=1 Tax=Daldinia decipiens TaxID=326647 RepID=UPI0020C58718|nr:uncharacterized protein F4813DRAFT_210968 [Daldinia decipiens]KAI1654275.1 hypothetical protein F4813DRAFT_210968 [Daldinia decipiens]
MTAITKTTRGPDGTQSTLTYRLPPQTTPFAPSQSQAMPSSCSFSVYCRSLSYYVYSMNTAAHDAHPLEGQHCLAVQDLTSERRVGYNAECWPENYFALFDNEWGELNGAPRSGNEGSASTAAFPGDKCLAGWTVACTTTVTAGGGDIDDSHNSNGNRNGSENRNPGNERVRELYPQAWCCPPGQWTCATATAQGDRQAPQRLCQSYLTGSASTDIWMYWDPEFNTQIPDGSTSSLFEAYTWTADVPGEPDPAHAATVFRKVFPLVLSSSAGAGADTSTNTNTDTNNPGLGAEASEEPAVVVTVTEIVTLEPTPRTAAARDRRTEPAPAIAVGGPLLPPGAHMLTSRCLAAVLLGAAFATAVMSFFGVVLLYRGRRTRTRRREEPRYRGVSVLAPADDTVSKASREDAAGKCEVGVLFQPREVETS